MNYIAAHDTAFKPDWRSEFKRLQGAYATATIKSYLSDIEVFVGWCEKSGIVPFPASVASVCEFLEAQAPKLAPATVRRRVYSIRKAHRLLRLPDPTWDEEVSLSLRRVRRAKLGRPRQAKGLTSVYRDAFLAIQPETPWGLRNRAMIALGYDLLTRRSELVAILTADIEPRDDGTLRVLIRRSKADPFGHGRIAFTSRLTAKLVAELLAWRGVDVEYLFCPIYHAKPVNRSLSATSVKRLIRRTARLVVDDPIEMNAFSGHSMRVGAAQDLLCAGYDTAAIMRAGGWKSINVLARYLEYAEHNVWAGLEAISASTMGNSVHSTGGL